MKNYIKIIIGILGMFSQIYAQKQPLGLSEIVAMANKNNAFVKSNSLRWQQAKSLEKTAFDLGKTEVYFNQDANNLAPNNQPLQVWGVTQSVEFPTVYHICKKLKSAETHLAEASLGNAQIRLEKQVSMLYYEYQMANEKVKIYSQLDSIYKQFSKSAARKFELGESNYLEKITANSKHKQILLQLEQSKVDKQTIFNKLKALVQNPDDWQIQEEHPQKLLLELPEKDYFKGTNLYKEQEKIALAELKLERHKLLPDLSLNLFSGTNNGISQNYNGFQIGVQLPLFFWGNSGKIKAAKYQNEIAKEQTIHNTAMISERYESLREALIQQERALEYYQTEGNSLADELLRMAQNSFKHGEIDYFQYILTLENVYQLKVEHLQSLNSYNQTLLQLHYLMWVENFDSQF